jgi:hypothetical protein
MRSRPALAARHGFDLPTKLKEVTGLDVDLLWSLLWALWAHFAKLTPAQAGEPFWPDQYLEPFSSEERAQVMRLVSSTSEDMARRVASFSTADVRPYNVLEFATWPLVMFRDRAICLSVKLLAKKLITGIHYLFLDYLTTSKERDLYLTVRGDVVQDYVHQLLQRCFPVSSGIYIPGDQLKRADGGRVCDGALFYGDAIVLLEIKGKQFDLHARIGNRESLDKKFEDIIWDGAQQLSETIAAFRSGALVIPGVKQGYVQTIFPVLILLEHLVMNPVTYQRMTAETKSKGLLTGLDTSVLQVFNIAEMEYVETGLEVGLFSLIGLLKAKISSDEWRGASLKNYLFNRHPGFAKSHNRYLRQIFDERTTKAAEIVTARGRAKDG